MDAVAAFAAHMVQRPDDFFAPDSALAAKLKIHLKYLADAGALRRVIRTEVRRPTSRRQFALISIPHPSPFYRSALRARSFAPIIQPARGAYGWL